MHRSLFLCCGLALLTAPVAAASGAVAWDGGGELFAGTALFAHDDTASGSAAAGRKTPSAQLSLFLHGSVDRDLSDDVTIGAFASLRVIELRRGTPPIEPDGDDPVRSAFVRVRHANWGEFQLGHMADVRVQQGLWAPQVCDCLDGVFGSNSPVITFNASPAGTNSTTQILDGRTVKLAWYGPEWDGVTLALSYAPERVDGYWLNPRLADAGRQREADLRQFWSAALEWQKVWGGTVLQAEAGLTRAERAPGPRVIAGRNDGNPLIWDVGTQLSYAAWKVGFGFEQQKGIAASGTYGAAAFAPNGQRGFRRRTKIPIVNRTIDLGFTYMIGPLTAGIAWSRAYDEGLADPANTKSAAINDIVFAGIRWTVRSGIDVLGGLQWNRYDPNREPVVVPAGARVFARRYSAIGPLAGLQARF